MIISASRRTDLPAYYSEWFFERLRARYVLVKNPMNPRQISRVSLAREDVDGIVFWTKDPEPMLGRLDELRDLPYYFQFTLNPYGTDVEPNVPSKRDVLIPVFQRLADIIGPGRVIWRYDPVILSEKYTIEYHLKYFEAMARRLSGYARRCTFSFLDIYRNTLKNLRGLGVREITDEDMHLIARGFADIARAYGLELSTCAEAVKLGQYGISHARCVDVRIFEELTGRKYKASKDPNQRAECGCAPSVDIGAYDCCLNGCRYCYANHAQGLVARNAAAHEPSSELLIGRVDENAKIIQRRNTSMLDDRFA